MTSPGLVPARSNQIGDGDHDVRGRYHPCWVGHRTLASTAADQRRFWTALAAGELCDLAVLTKSVEIGFEAPGFIRPSYGLGVMTDPGHPRGLLIGHGGGGPGYAAAAFAIAGTRDASRSCSARTSASRSRRPRSSSCMRMRGLEPPRPERHTDLNRARLPIPPHPRGATVYRPPDESIVVER